MASNEKIINKYLKAAKKDCPKRLRKKLDTAEKQLDRILRRYRFRLIRIVGEALR